MPLMARRQKKNITGVAWSGNTKTQVSYYVFGCINPGCKNYVVLETSKVEIDTIRYGGIISVCGACGFEYSKQTIENYLETKIPTSKEELEAILSEIGFSFEDASTEYVIHFFEAQEHWKYCSVCETLKPFSQFHKHKRTLTGRQHECSTCKNRIINTILNPLRTAEQLREGTEGRRLLFLTLGKETKIDKVDLLKKFGGICFNCSLPLTTDSMRLDHTLPAKLLWPLSLGPTPLCQDCNSSKAERWPSEVYSSSQIKRLAALTGITFEVLSGKQKLNPEAKQILTSPAVDSVIERGMAKPELLFRLRKLVLAMEGVDILDYLQNFRKSDIEKILGVNQK